MSMDWDEYAIYDPGVSAPLNMLPRAEARAAFDRLMAARPARVEMLRRLLKANGLDLGTTDSAIQDLDDWLRTHVQEDPAHPGRLLPEWYSVVNDIALFLGELMIQRRPALRWTFHTGGRKNVSYQRHVLTGFDEVPNPRYNVDIDRLVATYAHQIIEGQEIEQATFYRLLQAVEGHQVGGGGSDT
jgi:hypothetical protein